MANPTTSLQPVDFTVDVLDGYEHFYSVTGAAVTCTIPPGLDTHHRWLVKCLADTQFAYAGVSIALPEGKALIPWGENATVGFVVVGTNIIEAFGDLADA